MKHAVFRIALISLWLVANAIANAADSSSATDLRPLLPRIVELKAQPASLTLLDGRDERRVLVLGKADGEKWFDLTSAAVLKAGSSVVEVDHGFIKPKSKEKTELTITAAGHTLKVPVTV